MTSLFQFYVLTLRQQISAPDLLGINLNFETIRNGGYLHALNTRETTLGSKYRYY